MHIHSFESFDDLLRSSALELVTSTSGLLPTSRGQTEQHTGSRYSLRRAPFEKASLLEPRGAPCMTRPETVGRQPPVRHC